MTRGTGFEILTADYTEVMIMVVQHNLQAMNSNRMLGITQGSLSKSTEKLSSGYAINRAADNAAGLAISEKMRKQIRGLTQASANAEDGISSVQTAEGALTEVHDMLQRMNELAVQAANGTNSADDRSYIQDEIDQITQEIDRVAETTKFNETYLLKGDILGKKGYSFQYKIGNAQAAAVTFSKHEATSATVKVTFATPDKKNKVSVSDQNNLAKALRDQGVTVSAKTVVNTTVAGGNITTATTSQYVLELNGSDAKANYKVTETATKGTFEIQDLDGNKIAEVVVGGIKSGNTAVMTANKAAAALSTDEIYEFYDKDGNAISENNLSNYFTVNTAGSVIAKADAPAVYDALGNELSLSDIATSYIGKSQNQTAALGMSFHVGADGTDNNKININIDAMTAKSLGVNGLKVSGEDGSNATDAIDTISAAIKKVSTQRSALGAVQNRLEHTIKNLDNIVENTTSAESAIRDTDMANEMVKYSNNNILSQAGQSMLAQANQSNQGVLSILG